MIIAHNYFLRVMLQNLVSVFELVLGNLRETGTIEGVYAGKRHTASQMNVRLSPMRLRTSRRHGAISRSRLR